MRTRQTALILSAMLLVMLLGGCARSVEGAAGSEARGRYSGVGLYPAGQMWAQISHPENTNAAAAKLADDEEIIVSIDSRTGELRQCGNVSGYCIAMNPWTSAASQHTPAPLQKHADALAQDHAAATAR